MGQIIIEVSIDEGSNGVKVAWFENGVIEKRFLPARVIQGATTNGAGEYSQSAYLADDMEYTVSISGDGALPTDTQAYQVSPYNRVLVHEALRRFGFGGKKVNITVTLPIGDFLAVKPRNDALIQEKKNNLLKPVENLAGCEMAEIVGVNVSPEAAPAWINYLLNTEGQQVVEATEETRILIVDGGGTTTDMAVIDGLGNIQKSISVRCGGFQIGENLKPLIINRFNRRSVDGQQLDKALKSCTFAGEDIREDVNKACASVEEKVYIEMIRFQPEAADMDAVLYVGGLASLISPRLSKKYGGHSIVGDIYSIVSGLVKQSIYEKMAA